MAARPLAGVVAIPGARRPETARSAARRRPLELDAARNAPRSTTPSARFARGAGLGRAGSGEVVIVMGIPGAGKSRLAEDYAERGYERLNRDERGGSLRELAAALDERARRRAPRRVVLDNTYLTPRGSQPRRRGGRPARRRRSGACGSTRRSRRRRSTSSSGCSIGSGRCRRPRSCATLRAASRGCSRRPRRCGRCASSSRRRSTRASRPSSEVAFVRTPPPGAGAAACSSPPPRFGGRPGEPRSPGPIRPHRTSSSTGAPGRRIALGDAARLLQAAVAGPVEAAACPHPGGPPRCWCRPPLPGLALAFCARPRGRSCAARP